MTAAAELLRLDELGIDRPADVVGGDDAQHAHLARLGVHLDLGGVGAEGAEDHVGRDWAPGCRWSSDLGLRQQRARRGEREPARRRPRAPRRARPRATRSCGETSRCSPTAAKRRLPRQRRRLQHGGADLDGDPRGVARRRVVGAVGVAVVHVDALGRHPQLLGDDHRQDGDLPAADLHHARPQLDAAVAPEDHVGLGAERRIAAPLDQ